jgi:hypothetical protein
MPRRVTPGSASSVPRATAVMEETMNKIATLAAVLLVGTVFGGPAVLAQTAGTPNSGAGVPGSGPLVKPGEQSTGVSQDQSKVPGLPGNKSGLTSRQSAPTVISSTRSTLRTAKFCQRTSWATHGETAWCPKAARLIGSNESIKEGRRSAALVINGTMCSQYHKGVL